MFKKKKENEEKEEDSPEEVLKLPQTGTRADKRSPRESATAGRSHEAATSLPPSARTHTRLRPRSHPGDPLGSHS